MAAVDCLGCKPRKKMDKAELKNAEDSLGRLGQALHP